MLSPVYTYQIVCLVVLPMTEGGEWKLTSLIVDISILPLILIVSAVCILRL